MLLSLGEKSGGAMATVKMKVATFGLKRKYL